VRRTAPFAGLVFALLVLWYATELQAGRAATWLARPWYRRKAAPSFPDVLATFRQQGLATATASAASHTASTGFLTPRCLRQPLRKSRRTRHLTGALRA